MFTGKNVMEKFIPGFSVEPFFVHPSHSVPKGPILVGEDDNN